MAAETCRKSTYGSVHLSTAHYFFMDLRVLGKTHLMQAVGNALLQAKPNARVMYMTAESFVQDFVETL